MDQGVLQAVHGPDNTSDQITLESNKTLTGKQKHARALEALGTLASGIVLEINTPAQYATDNVAFLQEAVGEFIQTLKTYEEMFEKLPDDLKQTESFTNFRSKINKEEIAFLIDEAPLGAEQAMIGLQQVAQIVGAIKSFSHPQKNDKTLADLNKIVQTAATLSRNEWKFTAQMNLWLDDTIPQVLCFPTEIHQVMLNLILNAVDAIKSHTPFELGVLDIATEKKGDWVEVRVCDTGCGIDEAIKNKVMEPFFTTKPVGEGSGHGLALCKTIIEKEHKGEIMFENNKNTGVTFTIRLPLLDKNA